MVALCHWNIVGALRYYSVYRVNTVGFNKTIKKCVQYSFQIIHEVIIFQTRDADNRCIRQADNNKYLP